MQLQKSLGIAHCDASAQRVHDGDSIDGAFSYSGRHVFLLSIALVRLRAPVVFSMNVCPAVQYSAAHTLPLPATYTALVVRDGGCFRLCVHRRLPGGARARAAAAATPRGHAHRRTRIVGRARASRPLTHWTSVARSRARARSMHAPVVTPRQTLFADDVIPTHDTLQQYVVQDKN
jgi:hypothetical protein